MPSLEELRETLEARMDEILERAGSLDRSPRSTITPDRSRADVPGQHAIEVLRQLGPDGGALELGGTIGQGGMGVVRLGRQVALGREVAVKTIKDDVRSDAAALKILREAWVTGALEHPNVVPIYDISIDAEGSPRIVLKKIAGSDWASLMRDEKAIQKRFSARDAFEWNVRILMHVCNAVHFAHSRGILHRDLKPENVMIGEFGEVYVLDWGIAVSLHDDGTGRLPLAKDATELAGTPAYMAPEMLGGPHGTLSTRTDVYLLGAVLYEIVAGHPPHDAPSLMEIFYQVAKSQPELPEGTPDELVRIVRRAMDADPDARFESVEQLRLALSGFLEHRGSLKLADEAAARLRELDEELARPVDDPEEKRERIYHLFGECRFGFLEALRAWRENETARTGLRRAVTTMIELELAQGDPKAAAVLLGELPDAPADLLVRVTEAKKAREREDAHREKLARELDPSVGRRTRVFVSVVLGTIWTIAPLIGGYLESEHGGGAERVLAWAVGMLFVAGAVAYWARDSLSRTAINRRLARIVGIALLGQVGLAASTLGLGVGHLQSRVTGMLLFSLTTAITAATVEGRLWPSAAAMSAGFVLACFWPEHAYPLQSAANLFLTVNVVLVWARIQEDVLDPLRERHERRRRAFEEWLARRDARLLEPRRRSGRPDAPPE